MRTVLTIFLVTFIIAVNAQQVPVDDEPGNSTQLEDLAEGEESTSEDEHDSQQMQYLAMHPVDINSSEVDQITWIDI